MKYLNKFITIGFIVVALMWPVMLVADEEELPSPDLNYSYVVGERLENVNWGESVQRVKNPTFINAIYDSPWEDYIGYRNGTFMMTNSMSNEMDIMYDMRFYNSDHRLIGFAIMINGAEHLGHAYAILEAVFNVPGMTPVDNEVDGSQYTWTYISEQTKVMVLLEPDSFDKYAIGLLAVHPAYEETVMKRLE